MYFSLYRKQRHQKSTVKPGQSLLPDTRSSTRELSIAQLFQLSPSQQVSKVVQQGKAAALRGSHHSIRRHKFSRCPAGPTTEGLSHPYRFILQPWGQWTGFVSTSCSHGTSTGSSKATNWTWQIVRPAVTSSQRWINFRH